MSHLNELNPTYFKNKIKELFDIDFDMNKSFLENQLSELDQIELLLAIEKDLEPNISSYMKEHAVSGASAYKNYPISDDEWGKFANMSNFNILIENFRDKRINKIIN